MRNKIDLNDDQIPIGEQRIDGQMLHVSGESFVQPKIVPPFHGDQIAEPHMGQFVSDRQAYAFRIDARAVFAVKQLCFTERDQTPILHRAGREIGYGDEIWDAGQITE